MNTVLLKSLLGSYYNFMRSFNGDLINYPENKLIFEIQNYVKYFPLDEPLKSAYDKYKNILRTTNSNFDELKQQNNELELRIQFVLYFKLLKRISTNSQLITNKEDVNDFFNSLSDEEIQSIYDQVKKDLEKPNQESNSEPCQLIPFLKSVCLNWDGEHPIIQELILHNDTQPKIVFYPSSHDDLTDIEYFEREGDEYFDEHSIFLHVDYYKVQQPFHGEEVILRTFFSDNSTVHIFKKTGNQNKIKWLIFFNQTKNDDVFLKIIEGKLQIHSLISKCDAIVSGMGGHDGYSNPTIFYLCFSSLMGLQFVFTEYGTPFWNAEIDRREFEERCLIGFKNWMETKLDHDKSSLILNEIDNLSISQIINHYATERTIEGTGMIGCSGMNPQFYLLVLKK